MQTKIEIFYKMMGHGTHAISQDAMKQIAVKQQKLFDNIKSS
jgi:hypothetical protein